MSTVAGYHVVLATLLFVLHFEVVVKSFSFIILCRAIKQNHVGAYISGHKNVISSRVFKTLQEPQHDKTNKMTCALSEHSDQPGHPPRLIRALGVRSIGSQGPKASSCGQVRLISLGGCPS